MSYVHVLPNNAKETESKEYGKRDIEKEYESVECKIEGEVPDWINGSFYKQAGGAFGEDMNQLDGLAHLASFKLSNGSITFTNKFMRSTDYFNFINSGKRDWIGTGRAPKTLSYFEQISKKVLKIFENLNFFKKNTNLVPYSEEKYKDANPNVTTWFLDNGNILAAQTESGGGICSVDPLTLETKEKIATMEAVQKNGLVIQTPAHFFREGDNGGFHVGLELQINFKTIIPTFTFCSTMYHGDVAPFRIVRQDKLCSFKYTERETFNQNLADRPSYMHGIATCNEYVIRLDASMKYDVVRLLSQNLEGGFFKMTPFVETPVVFTVFKRVMVDGVETLDLVKRVTSTENLMLWHVSNCFVENERIIIETTCSEDLYEKPNFLARFNIDLENETVDFTKLVSNGEFPIVNPSYLFKQQNFTYIVEDALVNGGKLQKLNMNRSEGLESKPTVLYELFESEDLLISETCFIQNPNGNEEDDGCLLCMVADSKKEESYLAIIDAKSGKIIGTAASPVPINIGLHTNFLPQQGLENYTSKM